MKVNDENIKIRIQYPDPNPDMYSDPDMDSDPDPDMDSLLRGMDPGIRIRIRIHHKMSWIRNIAHNYRATSSSGSSVPLFFFVFNFEFFVFQTRTCYFHFLKALRKHLGDCHILPLLATNAQFASFVHLVYCLPYVPTANVIDVYEDVILKSLARIKKSTHPDIVANIGNISKWVDYLERTWIGREEKERSKTPGG